MKRVQRNVLPFLITLMCLVACTQTPQPISTAPAVVVSPTPSVPSVPPFPEQTASPFPKGAATAPEIIGDKEQEQRAMAPKPMPDTVHHVKGGIEFSVNASPLEQQGKTSFQIIRITEKNPTQVLVLIDRYINQTQVVTLKGHAINVWEYCGFTNENVKSLVMLVPDTLWEKGSRATLDSLEGATLNFCPAAN